MMMNNPELYKHNNGLQKKEAIDCLELYANKLKWIDCCKIMDIGCGDGGTTMNILKRYLPPNFTQLIGCDKNIKMIEFAKEHHCDERTIFIVQDIEHDLRSELKNEFGHVFSFTALQWITDNRKAFQNIYDLLTKDGSCLLMFPGPNLIYEIFRTLSRNNKWKPYLQDIERFVSSYQDMEHPDKAVHEYMTKSGFHDINVKWVKKNYIYETMEIFKNSMKAISPFVIPTDLYEDFFDDCVNVAKDMDLVEKGCDEKDDVFVVNMKYTVLIAHGTR